MNSDNFADFLKNPAQLYQITYQELKSLVLQYPFNSNLRFLLLKKSQLEGHKDFERNLQMAATYLPHRKILYEQLVALQGEEEAEAVLRTVDEVLELKDLSELEFDWLEQDEAPLPPLEDSEETPSPPVQPDRTGPEVEQTTSSEMDDLFNNLASESETETETEAEGTANPEVDALFDEVEEELEQQENKEVEMEESPSQEGLTLQTAIRNTITISEIFQPSIPRTPNPEPQTPPIPTIIAISEILGPSPSPGANRKPPAPLPKTAFPSWVREFQRPNLRLQIDILMEAAAHHMRQKEKKKKKKKKEKALRAQQMAQRSIQENQEIASETLATLLEKQGHIEKAIAMYERLRLIFPEKSGFFAGKIEQLKNTLT